MRLLSISLIAWSLSTAAVLAEPSDRELQIIARALTFLQPQPDGVVEVGIPFADGDSGGQARAERVRIRMAALPPLGAIVLNPRIVSWPQALAPEGPRILVLSDTMAVPELAAETGRLIVGDDPSCVDRRVCAISVRGEPNVEIEVSRSATAAAGFEFQTAFRLMIRERD